MATGSLIRVWLGGVLLLTMVPLLGCEPAEAPRPATSPAKPEADPASAPPVDGGETTSDTADDPFADVPDSPFANDDAATSDQPDGPAPDEGAEPEAASEPHEDATDVDDVDIDEEPVVDLGPPLVENLEEDYQPLDPKKPIWINRDQTQVVTLGQVVQDNVPLELFACPKGTKEHEAIVAVPVEAFLVHTALLAVGAETGSPAQFNPEYRPATGSKIEILVRWKDAEGRQHTNRAQEWIVDAQTGDPMQYDWVFAGSGFWQDEQTGRQHYMAEQGDLICVSNFPTATLDLPIESSDSNDVLLFRANSEKIPPIGTPVTLLLSPVEEAE